MTRENPEESNVDGAADDRRGFLGVAATAIMAGGLVSGYGLFVGYAGRFLFPASRKSAAWQFVATLDRLSVGESIPFQTPSGQKVVVARQADGDTAEDFIALSSVCPHLGCQVHWEAQNDRFFCPCHNGAFDATGKPTEGPPATAGQELTRFPLTVQNNLLFIEVPLESVIRSQET